LGFANLYDTYQDFGQGVLYLLALWNDPFVNEHHFIDASSSWFKNAFLNPSLRIDRDSFSFETDTPTSLRMSIDTKNGVSEIQYYVYISQRAVEKKVLFLRITGDGFIQNGEYPFPTKIKVETFDTEKGAVLARYEYEIEQSSVQINNIFPFHFQSGCGLMTALRKKVTLSRDATMRWRVAEYRVFSITSLKKLLNDIIFTV